MSMKWFIIKKRVYTLFIFCLLGITAYAQELETTSTNPYHLSKKDTIIIVKYDTVWVSKVKDNSNVITSYATPSRHDKRVHRYRKRWESLIPTHSKVQFAGNMGLLSIGVGWDYGKQNQWETDVLFGIIPKYNSKRTKATITVKQNYIPWSVDMKGPFSFEPLTCGLYFNTALDNDFWVREPDRYPKGYYGFSSKIRTHAFVGQRLAYDIPHRRYMAKTIVFFYEISTCDLYIVSAFTNKYLKPTDYLSLSFGVKVQLF